MVFAAICLLLLPSVLPEIQSVQAAQPAAAGALLPPVSISLTTMPGRLPPGGHGVVIVQLVDMNGNPSPARQDATVSLFSSDPTIAGVSQQVMIPFGKSHVDAQLKAGIEGSATLTATADGLLSGSAKVSSSVFSDFALQLVPMNNPVSPGDPVQTRVELTAAGHPFEAPAGVKVTIATSLQGVSQQTVEIEPESSAAYFSVNVPSSLSNQGSPYMTITAAATGFTSALAAVGFSPPGSNPRQALVGARRSQPDCSK